MKLCFLVGCFVVVLLAGAWNAGIRGEITISDQPQEKLKTKGDRVIVRDKSKPVRAAIEEWYEHNKAAFSARDLNAIMSLRTPDFHTITPDGKLNTRADMEKRTKSLIEQIDRFITQEFEIGSIDVHDDLASADVKQRTVRIQRLSDGMQHKVEASVVQRETWKLTDEGWKMYLVDNIRDGVVLLDDKPYPPR